jgi:ribosomal protein L11 methyltransferase
MSPNKSMKEKTTTWTILSCQLDVAEEDLCSWQLFEQGTLGLEISNVNEKTLSIKASFRPEALSKEKVEDLRYRFKQAGLETAANTLTIESLANEDWLTNWKKHFEPFHVGDSFLICPPWLTKNLKDKDIAELRKIIIDPGMAFGTGLHTTTSYCLHAIEKHLQGPNVLDVGTGSGILSIASTLLLPEANITAIDIDEHAIENASHNIALNHVEAKIKLHQESLESFEKTNKTQFNTILSNMTAEAIIDFLPIYKKILITNGILILAGIIEERLNLLENTISQYPFKLINKEINKGWVGLVFIKE